MTAMQLRFLGKDSTPTNSPTLYATDEGSYIVQGWVVTDPEILSRLNVSEGETLVEVPPRLMAHLAKDGLSGEVGNLVSPVAHVKDNGNYIIKAARVTDPGTLAQMKVPDHETCVEVASSAMAALLVGQ
jgi:hypothetical protein